MTRANILGVGLSPIDLSQATGLILDAVRQNRKGYVAVTGVHGVSEAQSDPEFRQILNAAFLNTPDGMPMTWVGRLQGFQDMDRVYGPDLMLSLCAATQDGSVRHFFYGGCGDFSVGKRLLEWLPAVHYVGCDLVPELIEHHRGRYGSDRIQFQTLDMVSQELPDGDICLIRQVFQHLANRDIACVLPKLRKYRAVFVTEAQPLVREGPANPEKPAYADMRFDGRTGCGRGVELDQPPWNLTIKEVCRAPGTGIKEIIITHRICA